MAKVPHGHWQTMTFLAALRRDRITAPCVFDGPINGESFRPTSSRSWCRRCSQATSSSWTISARTRAAPSAARSARPARSLLFLPPYSPDLNPIEQVFAKLKTLLRKAEERTVEGVWQRIGSLLERFTPQRVRQLLRNAGYASI